ncbi:helix-turn-helix transcriptional regulator [Clostridium sp. CTA-5]
MDNPKINLKYYREHKGISQRQLSIMLSISQGYISAIEKGHKSPTIRMLYRLADALEICPRLLLPCIIECRTRCDFEENLK